MTKRRFAADTRVPVERSRAEIDRLLSRAGASEVAFHWRAGEGAVVAFDLSGRLIRVALPMAPRAQFERTATGRERSPRAVEDRYRQEERRRWRALALFLRAKLEAVESGISTLDQEFLAYLVVGGGDTVGDRLIPQLEQALRDGDQLPRLLPGGAR